MCVSFSCIAEKKLASAASQAAWLAFRQEYLDVYTSLGTQDFLERFPKLWEAVRKCTLRQLQPMDWPEAAKLRDDGRTYEREDHAWQFFAYCAATGEDPMKYAKGLAKRRLIQPAYQEEWLAFEREQQQGERESPRPRAGMGPSGV